MYSDFKPLFLEEKEKDEPTQNTVDKEEKNTTELLEEEIKKLRREKEEYLEKIKALEQEKSRLEETLKRLQEEKSELVKRIDVLNGEVESLKRSIEGEKLIKELAQSLKEHIEKNLSACTDDVKKDLIEVVKELLQEMLLNESLPLEGLAEAIIQSAFERLVHVNGSVKVYVSPEDYDSVNGFILELKAGAVPGVDILCYEDKSLKRGEVRIDTPRLVVERRHEEYLEEALNRIVEDVFKRS